MTTEIASSADINKDLGIYRSYKKSPYLSIKHDSYFQVYEKIFQRFVGQPIIFVEVGVLNGGSLFMWRDYFGPQARIIGVDFNPGAKKWVAEGFEIHIGDQSSEAFWDQFYKEVGPIDVLLDDGGHTNRQQIVTTVKAINHIRDGGVIAVEDTHASYMKEFGNPSRYSFSRFANHVSDVINRRYPQLNDTKGGNYWRHIFSVEFFESIIVFNVDKSRCFVTAPTSNGGESANAQDFREQGTVAGRATVFFHQFRFLKAVLPFARVVKQGILQGLHHLDDLRLRKYFD